MSVRKLAEMTSIKEENIIQVLEELKILRYYDGNFIFACDETILSELSKKSGGKKGPEVNEEKLLWVPFKHKYA